MKDRLVAFTVEHPQLEYSPNEANLGRKKANVWKNQGSPSMLLGSLNIFSTSVSPTRALESPTNVFELPACGLVSPMRNLYSPLKIAHSPHSESPVNKRKAQDNSLYSLMLNFPKYTKAHPKIISTSPIIENLSPQKRMGSIATHIINNRKSIG